MFITPKFSVNKPSNRMVKKLDKTLITFYNLTVIHIRKNLKYF